MTVETKAEPMVSVVVPTLDRQESLERAIRSFSSQDYDNCEIVIVDQSRSGLSPGL